jgi:quercetin dioxygenase-like cupin family protein
MSDPHGLKRAAELGIELGNVGQKLLLENEHIRVWEVALEPGETIDFHIHHHPYLVVSLGGGDNEVETIFGDKRPTHEPLGHMVFMDTMRPVHKLTNKGKIPYLSRLIELKHLTLGADEPTTPAHKVSEAVLPKEAASPSADTANALKEFLVQTDDLQWAEKSLDGLSQKMLWRNEETGASIALIKFEKGSGIPDPHLHASSQFMYCISGKYRYIPTGLTLTPGAFYCNPKGCVHGPTIADETSIFLEIYDGPHYPVRPTWYENDEDAS